MQLRTFGWGGRWGPRLALLLLGGTAVRAAPAAAQTASPYLHLHHPAYAEIELLLERGVFRDLSPVVRPYRRGDIARALLELDPLVLRRHDRARVQRLAHEFRREMIALDDPRGSSALALSLTAEATARNQWHRDPLRAVGDGGVTGAGEMDLRATFGIVAAESRLRSDNYYRHDPQFPLRVARNRFNQRAEDAYLEVQGEHVRGMLGRLYRNWGAPGMQGTLLSDYAYSFDQAALWAGTRTISLTLVTGRLDDFPGDMRRYVALHRVDFRPSRNVSFYAAEAVLYSGELRPYEFDFLNPLSFWFTENENQAQDTLARNNAFLSAGFWWRVQPFVIAFGDFMLDDVQVDTANEPPSYAFYAGLVFPRLSNSLAGRFSYSQVANLAYRTTADFEQYTFRGLGLGRDFADYDLLAAQLDWLGTDRLHLVGRFEWLRRGEGDFREPFPLDASDMETVLSGRVERTIRLSLGGRLYLGAGTGAVLTWDAGSNFVRNAAHVAGATDRRFTGSIALRLTGGWGSELP